MGFLGSNLECARVRITLQSYLSEMPYYNLPCLQGERARYDHCDLFVVYLKLLIVLRMKSCHSRDFETLRKCFCAMYVQYMCFFQGALMLMLC